jgi:hypothetical protein
MAACATLFQCYEFLAANDATIGLTRDPNDATKNRMTITIPLDKGEDICVIEYSKGEECDLVAKVLGPVCRTLIEHYEKVVENE